MPLKTALRKRDERGSLIVALAVISVVMVVSLALVTRTITNLDFSTYTQHSQAALAQADAGIADALFRIDQVPPGPTVTPATFTGASPASAPTGTPANSTWSYTATPQPVRAPLVGSYTVKAIGVVNGVKHAAQETVTSKAAFPYAVFVQSLMTFDGANQHIAAYDTTYGTTLEVGSNGTISCTNNPVPGVTYVYSGQASPQNCGSQTQQLPTPVPLTMPPLPANPLPCPGTGPGNGTIGTTGGTTTLNGGVYLCPSTVTMNGTIQIVNGPVKIYIDPPSGTEADLDIGAGAVVNASTTTPDSTQLQIYMYGTGNLDTVNGSSNSYTFGGVIYAPNAGLKDGGCKSTYYGALILNSFTCTGGPHLQLNYDEKAAILGAPWQTSDYHEVSPQ